jgi:hypothetical protein
MGNVNKRLLTVRVSEKPELAKVWPPEVDQNLRRRGGSGTQPRRQERRSLRSWCNPSVGRAKRWYRSPRG